MLEDLFELGEAIIEGDLVDVLEEVVEIVTGEDW